MEHALILNVIKRELPEIALHISTQTNTLNSEAVKFWRDFGVSRVILARELSIKQISQIRKNVPDIELEVFVHGAQCVSLSGRCLLSDYMTHGERKANHGGCSQPCRWKNLTRLCPGSPLFRVAQGLPCAGWENPVLRLTCKKGILFPVRRGEIRSVGGLITCAGMGELQLFHAAVLFSFSDGSIALLFEGRNTFLGVFVFCGLFCPEGWRFANTRRRVPIGTLRRVLFQRFYFRPLIVFAYPVLCGLR